VAVRPARARWISANLLLVCGAVVAAQAQATVIDLLRALGATGVDVLYSSDLVPPDLDAPAVLLGSDPLSRVMEALAAHHLLLRNVGPRRYIVTREPAPRAAPATASNPRQSSPQEAALDEVSVFASRYVFEDTAIGEPASFTESDLQQMPGSQQDALRAIRASPGLATNLSSRPYIRGAFLDDVLVQFDGIPLVDPFHFKSFQSLISAFDPAAVGRIDVYTGGFPVNYGTRSAGVFDLAPRTVESGNEQRVGASLLSYDFSSVGRAESWPVEWLATFRHSAHDIALRPINGDVGEPTYIDALGRIRWQAGAVSAWTLGWLLLDDRIALATEPVQEQADARDRDLYAWIASDWNPSGALHSHTSISVTNIERSRGGTLSLAGVADGWLAERRDSSVVDLRTAWSFVQSAQTTLNFGAAAGLETAELAFDRQERFTDVIGATFARPTAALTSRQALRASTLGFYASFRRQWQALDAEIGARLDRQDYRSLGSHAQMSPRFNLRFDPTPDWHLYGSWGLFTQAQRVGEWRSEENQAAPDPATRAEHLIAGIMHESANATHWRLEAYRNHWTSVSPHFDNSLDAQVLLPELGPDRLRLAPNSAETAGIELSARRAFGPGFEASAAYALSRTTDDLNGRDVPRSWDQPHAVSVDMAWREANFSTSLLVGWHSGWPRTPVSVVPGTHLLPAYFVVGARNSARWGDYLSADLRISKIVPIAYGELTLWVDAANVTDQTNDCCTGFSPEQPGNIPATYTETWLSRVINAGFVWRFGPPRVD
jgi:outer membrane receptor protein involved in Fe transport